MEEEFYATLKLSSGEEIIAKVCYLTHENSLLVNNPMIVERIIQKKKGKTMDAFQLKEWIASSYEDMYIIKMDHVITITEADKKIELFYTRQLSSEYSEPVSNHTITKDMGYLGSVKETKKLLEKIFNNS